MAVEGRVQRPIVDNSRCTKCGLCRLLCPDLCITLPDGAIAIEIDYDFCKGCGICASECPRSAISMESEV